jgi:hypothetical protein
MSSNPSGATQHLTDKGMEAALGIGRNGKRLNTNAADLQDAILDVRDEFLEVRTTVINNVRHDFLRNGLLAEIVSRTPILVYDLPELKQIVDTAFVDRSGKMYFCDTFLRTLLAEHEAGLDSLNFLIRHEADHLRRLHLTRMQDINPQIANIAQDVRINIDITKAAAADRFEDERGRAPSDSELKDAARAYLVLHADSIIASGQAMTYEDYIKYDGLSEEAIAAILLKDWKDPPPIPNREVSFERIMEGAAQEADGVKGILLSAVPLAAPPLHAVLTPAELSGLAQDLRRIGAAKANPNQVSDKDLQDSLGLLQKLKEHPGLIDLDRAHDTATNAVVGTGNVHLSGKTGDNYLDALRPSERVKMAMQIIQKILTPSAQNGMPGQPQDGGLTVKDLERSMGRGKGSDPKSQGDTSTVPHPLVSHGQDHVMDTADLIEVLKAAGLNSESMKKMGFDDLKSSAEEIKCSKDSVVASINKASEDMMKLGSRYPGGHLVHYAKAQMADFFKPVLTWEMAMKKMTEALGKGQRMAPEEPWTIYHVDAADMGLKHQRDVPYLGSTVPGKTQKPLMIDIIDTSGSVDDAMLKRFVSEAINMSRKMSRGNAPDVVISFADTIARGEPVYITERNYKDFLTRGIQYGGRGGTNFQAAIENVFELVKPGAKGVYAKREIDAIVYMTDTGDSVPDPQRLLRKAQECGIKKLPPILFLAPKACYSEHFDKAVKKWATVIWFPTGAGATNTRINVTDVAREQEKKNRNLVAAKP